MNDYSGMGVGLTDRLASIAAQMETPDERQRLDAVARLSEFLEDLPDWILEPEEALTLLGLAIAILNVLPCAAEDPARLAHLTGNCALVIRAASTFATAHSGVSIDDRMFFEAGRSRPIQ